MTVKEMRLDPDVAAKALELERRAPGVIFTSGRRNVFDQARAMAENCVQNRRYIEQTYANSPAREMLQRWVNNHPDLGTVPTIANGLYHVMMALAPVQLGALSKHLTGRAFDVQPHSCSEEDIRALSPRQFLTEEGGLIRWHVGF